MSKWRLMLLGLALTFGVTACSTPATEPETAEEAPVEEEAEEEADAAEAVPCSPRDGGAEVEIRIENVLVPPAGLEPAHAV